MQWVTYQKLPIKEMIADQDANWIVISSMFYKRAQVVLNRKCEDDPHRWI